MLNCGIPKIEEEASDLLLVALLAGGEGMHTPKAH